MAHKTDFKDALFEQRKYRMQSNPDGTVTPIDETEYSQEGTRVGAKYFNETGEALNDLENPVFEDYTSTVAPDPETALGLIKSKASFKALFQNIKAALLGMVFKKNVLTSMEEVNANTDEDMVAGALAVKELSRDLAECKLFTEGSGVDTKYYIQMGADSASKKLLGKSPIFFSRMDFCARNNDGQHIYLNDLEDYEKVTIESITHSGSTGKKFLIYGITDTNTHELIFTETPPSNANVELDIKKFTGIYMKIDGWSGETTIAQSFIKNMEIS